MTGPGVSTAVEAGAEAGEQPVDRGEHNLDAVVDAVLEQEQRHPDGRQTEASLDDVGNGDEGKDDWAEDQCHRCSLRKSGWCSTMQVAY